MDPLGIMLTVSNGTFCWLIVSKHVYLGTRLTCFPHQTDVAHVQLVFAQIRGYINYSLDLIAITVPPPTPPHSLLPLQAGKSCKSLFNDKVSQANPALVWSDLVRLDSNCDCSRHFWWPLGPDNFDQNQLETRFHHYRI